jgi:serine/threonine protein kinase/ligand-binding sensor domain-containing protein
MPRVNRLCLILLLSVFCSVVEAQQNKIKFDHLSIEQGLSQSNVFSILQDRQGFIWFGTQDGLNKFDGYNFTVYKNRLQDSTSISDNYINVVYEDKKGTLWVGTAGGGLNRYDPRTQSFTAYRHDPNKPSTISNNYVYSILEDHNGGLWVATLGGGLNRFDSEKENFTVYRNDPGNPRSISGDRIFSLLEDRNGTLWVGTSNGLNKFDSKTGDFTVYKHDPKVPGSISDSSVRAICEDSSGTLWVGSAYGLNRYNPESNTFTIYRNDPRDTNSISGDSILSIRESRTGDLWIGMGYGGLNIYNPKTKSFTAYRNDPKKSTSLSSDIVWSIYEDRSGTIWIGTFGGGISKFDPMSQRFDTYRNNVMSAVSLSHNNVWTVYEDQAGVLWVGTFGGGLNRYDPKIDGFITYRNNPDDPRTISNDIIYSIVEDREGMLWIGTIGGLNKFDRRSGKFESFVNDPQSSTSLSNDAVRVVYEDRSGKLWVGTVGNGLNRYEPKTRSFIAYSGDPKLPTSFSGKSVRTIFEDSKGRLWFGTYDGGLNRYDPGIEGFIVYRNDPNNPKSISSNNISIIYEDGGGMLWVGTYGGGLNRLDPKDMTFTAFTEKDGLPSDTIAGILEDAMGQLWISTTKGLSKFNTKIGKFRNYDASDGLQSNEFNMGACYKSRSGELLFGGINGLNRFYPEKILDNTYMPPIAITGFKISDKATPKAELVLAKAAGLLQEPMLELSSRESFSFDFTAFNFTNPEKNRYAYKLEGLDKEWNYCGTRRFASYMNLDPGEYVFRVKGSNNDGIWNEEGTAIKIKIIPPLWKTWWAYLLYIMSLAATGYGSHRYRLRFFERRNQLLEKKIGERTSEISKKNDELEEKNKELAQKNEELALINNELNQSRKRADLIFSALVDALPGTILDGKYSLDKKIGSGGFGVIYRATHIAMKRLVAVKVFKPAPGNESPEGLKRFQLEAVSACRINHPNAVAVYDSGVSAEGIAYLVMELLEGHPLADELKKRGKLSLRRCAEIIIPVCEALAEAHKTGIVHRDIKPDNIFLHLNSEGETVKVVDFGIAKLLDEAPGSANCNITITSGIIGTPVYMSPERLQNKSYDGRSDVYSVGILLYQMLCGQVPFPYGSGGIWQVIFSHFNTEPEPLTRIDSSIPAEIERVVLRALSKNPYNRPTANEMVEKLSAAFATVLKDPRFVGNLGGSAAATELAWDEVETVIVSGARLSNLISGRITEQPVITHSSPTSRAIKVMRSCPACLKCYEPVLRICPADSAPLYPVAVLDGKYILEERIGVGGMGEIFKAIHIELGKKWAIKVLHSDLVESEPGAVERFLNEARIMSRIDHPNVVKVVDFNKSKGTLYFVMELIEGSNLKSEISRLKDEGRRLSYKDILMILDNVCMAAQAAHSQNIIHRDLKSENIILIKDEAGDLSKIKVLDFGIALIKGSRFTRTKELIGTPEYMSPEHCDRKELDGRSDIYSIGIDLYEMLTGRVPFPIEYYEPHLILYKHMFERPLPLRQLCADIPEPIEEVVLRALEKRPEVRQQTVTDLAREFGEALKSAGVVEKI